MNKTLFAVAATLAFATVSVPANAGVTVIALPDIGTFTGYSAANTGQTYAGNGFVGLYGPSTGSSFAHLFGLEGPGGYSRTAIQANIAALAGQTISSAFLTFDLLDGETGSQGVSVVGFGGTGALGYVHSAPVATFGTANGTVNNGANSVNVTSLVSSAAGANATWLNLHLSTTDRYQWTYTYSGFGYSADRANLRLTINSVAAVPEPATWAMLLVGFGLIGGAMRYRRGKTAVSFG